MGWSGPGFDRGLAMSHGPDLAARLAGGWNARTPRPALVDVSAVTLRFGLYIAGAATATFAAFYLWHGPSVLAAPHAIAAAALLLITTLRSLSAHSC